MNTLTFWWHHRRIFIEAFRFGLTHPWPLWSIDSYDMGDLHIGYAENNITHHVDLHLVNFWPDAITTDIIKNDDEKFMRSYVILRTAE